MSNFSNYIKHILSFEGGYINDPDDPGGETNFGISKRAYPDLDIKDLTIKDATNIYFKDYWLASGCERLKDELQGIHFDTAVNMGVYAAVKLLQKTAGTVQDGKFGPITESKAKGVRLVDYAVNRCLKYAVIVKNRPTSVKYLYGWLRRVRDITKI